MARKMRHLWGRGSSLFREEKEKPPPFSGGGNTRPSVFREGFLLRGRGFLPGGFFPGEKRVFRIREVPFQSREGGNQRGELFLPGVFVEAGAEVFVEIQKEGVQVAVVVGRHEVQHVNEGKCLDRVLFVRKRVPFLVPFRDFQFFEELFLVFRPFLEKSFFVRRGQPARAFPRKIVLFHHTLLGEGNATIFSGCDEFAIPFQIYIIQELRQDRCDIFSVACELTRKIFKIIYDNNMDFRQICVKNIIQEE
jgi:hypothetical protein